jgi:hypothetical protein
MLLRCRFIVILGSDCDRWHCWRVSKGEHLSFSGGERPKPEKPFWNKIHKALDVGGKIAQLYGEFRGIATLKVTAYM